MSKKITLNQLERGDDILSQIGSILTDAHTDVRAVVTTNLSSLIGITGTHGGVTIAATDRILLAGQTNPVENGIYLASGTPNPSLDRASDADGSGELTVGSHVGVTAGTSANQTWNLTYSNQSPIVPGTSQQYWQQATQAQTAGVAATEAPSGSVNGINATFALTQTPLQNTLQLYRNGVCMLLISGADYSISGVTITTVTAPDPGDKLWATYRY